MPPRLAPSAKEWCSLLTSTGRVKRVSQLIAESLELPEAAEDQEFLSIRMARFVDSNGIVTLDALIGAGDTEQLRSIVGVRHSWFWREPEQFAMLVDRALNRVQRGESLHVWSAATASGQEAYSIAIALLEALGPDLPQVRILGTDLDTVALETARRGHYGDDALASLPIPLRRWLVREGQDDGTTMWRVGPDVRALVEFRPLDLLSLGWSSSAGTSASGGPHGPFDAIFCRNVLLYFGAPYRYAVLEALAMRLAPDGLLFLGQSENVGAAAHLFERLAKGVYKRRAGRVPTSVRSC